MDCGTTCCINNHYFDLLDYEVALPIDDLTMSLDANEETLSTLLCYLEDDGWIEVLNPVCDSVTIKCYGERNCLDNLAVRLPVIASALKNKISMPIAIN